MVDYKLFENILSQKDEGYVEEGDFLDFNIVKLFAASDLPRVRRLFKGTTRSSKPIGYYCEFECEKCGRKYITKVGKTRLFDILHLIKNPAKKLGKVFVCDECKQTQKEEVVIDQERLAALLEKQTALNTEKYIELYLAPDKKWSENVSLYVRIQRLSSNAVNRDVIIEYIRNMDYYDFLETPYWKAIARRVKYKAGYKCQLCNSGENLITHHRTYEHHGDEINHMADLICICKNCHEKYHFE